MREEIVKLGALLQGVTKELEETQRCIVDPPKIGAEKFRISEVMPELDKLIKSRVTEMLTQHPLSAETNTGTNRVSRRPHIVDTYHDLEVNQSKTVTYPNEAEAKAVAAAMHSYKIAHGRELRTVLAGCALTVIRTK